MTDIVNKTFLGVGLGFRVPTDDGSLALGITTAPDGILPRAAYEESVRQAIWIILSTAKGERLMRLDFGCGIHDLVFSMSTPETANRVVATVREALLDFEPRIDVREVTVSFSGAGEEVLLVDVEYEVRATNNVFNLVYPFYLTGGS